MATKGIKQKFWWWSSYDLLRRLAFMITIMLEGQLNEYQQVCTSLYPYIWLVNFVLVSVDCHLRYLPNYHCKISSLSKLLEQFDRGTDTGRPDAHYCLLSSQFITVCCLGRYLWNNTTCCSICFLCLLYVYLNCQEAVVSES